MMIDDVESIKCEVGFKEIHSKKFVLSHVKFILLHTLFYKNQ